MANSDDWLNNVGQATDGTPKLSDVIDKDIASLRDFAVGLGKGVSTQVAGIPGDIGSMRDAALQSLTGMDFTSPRDVGFPTTRDIEQAIGAYNPNPSTAEQAGSIASTVVDPAAILAKLTGAAKLGIVVGRKIPLTGEHAIDLNTQMMVDDPNAWVANGKLKTELSDAGASVKVDNIGKFLSNQKLIDSPTYQAMTPQERADAGMWTRTPIEDVLNHPELFNLYPELKGVTIAPYYPGDANKIAAYNADSKTMFVNPHSNQIKSFDKYADQNNENFLSIAMHELQHGVQSVEGYSRGGNSLQFLEGSTTPTAWSETVARAKSRLDSATAAVKDYMTTSKITADDLTGLKAHNPELHQRYMDAVAAVGNVDKIRNYTFAQYENLPGEVEARVTEQRLKMTQEQADAKPFREHYEEELTKAANKVSDRFKQLRGY